jgi:hypothetical protein
MKPDASILRRACWTTTTGALGLILIILILPGSVAAQGNTEFDLTAIGGIGVGALGERIDRSAWGGSFCGALRVRGTPFFVGARLAMINYGSERNVDLADYPDSAPAGTTYKYDLLMTHLVVRYHPRSSRFTPYLEALIGINYFFTQAYPGTGGSIPIMVGDAILILDEDGSGTLLSSVTPSLGLGGGLSVRLAGIGNGKNADRSPLSLYLDLQGRYLLGGTASYLKPGNLAFAGDQLIAETERSRTDLFFCSLGLSLRGSFRKGPHASGR